jgi:hypothetical protein
LFADLAAEILAKIQESLFLAEQEDAVLQMVGCSAFPFSVTHSETKRNHKGHKVHKWISLQIGKSSNSY